MIRGMNSIYTQAHLPKTNSEKTSFAGYALTWCDFTKHHHEGVMQMTAPRLNNLKEEKFWFPECEKRLPGSMRVNMEQHHAFHGGLEALEIYFNQVQTDPSVYEGGKVTDMLDQFGSIFLQHLNDEIRTLEPENMRKIFKDPQEAKEIDKRLVAWVVETSNPTTNVPFVTSTSNLVNFRLCNTMILVLVHGGRGGIFHGW